MPHTPQTERERVRAQEVARRLFGNGVQVRDPGRFNEFLAEKETEFKQQSALRQLAEQEAQNAGILEQAGRAALGVGRFLQEQTQPESFLFRERPLFEPLVDPVSAERIGRNLPGIAGDIAGPVFGAGAEISTPFDIALGVGTAGLGAPLAAGLRAVPKVGRFIAPLVEPLAKTFPRALAAEAAIGTGAVLAAIHAGEALEDAPTPVRVGGALAAGLAGGVATLAAPAAGRRILKEAGELAVRADLPRRATQAAGRVLPERKVFAAGPEDVGRAADEALDAEIAAARKARAEQPPAPTADEAIAGQQIDEQISIGAQSSPEARLEADIAASRGVRQTGEQLQLDIAAERQARVEAVITPDEQLELDILSARGRLDESAITSESKRRPLARMPQEVADQALIGQNDVGKLTRLVEGLREIEPSVRADLEVRRSVVRKRNVAEGARRAARVGPQQKRAAFLSAQTELPSIPEFEALRPLLNEGVVDNLFSMIHRGNSLRLFEQATAAKGLQKLLSGKVPTPDELIKLQKVFGRGLIAAIENLQRSGGQRALDLLSDISGIPRGLLASYDISAVMRQGGLLSVSHPQKAFWGKNSAFVRMMKALVSEDAARDSLARIEANPKIQVMTDPELGRNALFIRNIFETDITRREEAFISRFIQRIPGIRASERAFSTYLNEITTKVAEDFIDGLIAQNVRISDGVGRDGIVTMAKFLNVATGRGTLGIAERSTLIKKLATVGFWSPRLVASRIQVPIEGIKAVRNLNNIDPAIRAASRQISRDLAIYVGGMTTFLWLLKLSGLAEVEVDPRSSDFGKIRIGNTRLDTWAGFQQIARYTAQLITGQAKSPITGETDTKSRVFTLGSFIRSKLAPGGPSVGATFLPRESLILPGLTGGGINFIGERVEPGTADPRGGGGVFGPQRDDRVIGLNRFIIEQLAPLFGQDIYEALKEDGLLGASLGLSGALGIGVVTFESEEGAERRQ